MGVHLTKYKRDISIIRSFSFNKTYYLERKIKIFERERARARAHIYRGNMNFINGEGIYIKETGISPAVNGVPSLPLR